MKNLLKRVMSIAAATALLMTSVISAAAADPGHSHKDGKPITTEPDPYYTITLTHPHGENFVEGTDTTGSHYGAYQIFSGTVKGTPEYTNPGTSEPEQHIPITDIKWGNAFGIVGTNTEAGEVTEGERNKNIVSFVYALSKAQKGDYSYAFGDFDGFENFFKGDNLNLDYLYERDYLVIVRTAADGSISSIDNLNNVNYDKLAVAVADVLVETDHINNHEWLQAFNDILGGYGQGTSGYLNEGYVDRFYEGTVSSDKTKYEIKVPAGYYMIRDLSSFEGADKSYSARMLFVADNVTQELKEAVPTLEKKIIRVDGNTYETEAAGVGDEVKFQLHGTLPSNYNLYLGGYQYKFTDTLSNGLTLKDTDGVYVTVKVKGVYDDGAFVDEEYTIDKEKSYKTSGEHITHHDAINAAYKEEYNEETNELTVTFPCLKEILIDDKYTLGVDSQIYITYTAVVNENSVVSPKSAAGELNGNTNKAVLTYSDNPQSYGDTDNTTSDYATVYTFGLAITKVNAAEYLKWNGGRETYSLPGAKFVVLRKNPVADAANKWQIAQFIWHEFESPAPYYFIYGYNEVSKWVDIEGSTEDDNKIFDSDGKLKTEYDTAYDESEPTALYYNITSIESGALNVAGLDNEVTYTMVETATPNDDEYAKIAPFTIALTATIDDDSKEYNGTLSEAVASNAIEGTESFSIDKFVWLITPGSFADDNGCAQIMVANFKYTDLPSTGGIGVYIYYIAGGCAVVLALVLFALSKKKKSDK